MLSKKMPLNKSQEKSDTTYPQLALIGLRTTGRKLSIAYVLNQFALILTAKYQASSFSKGKSPGDEVAIPVL